MALKQVIKACGITEKSIADKMGLCPASITRIIRDETPGYQYVKMINVVNDLLIERLVAVHSGILDIRRELKKRGSR